MAKTKQLHDARQQERQGRTAKEAARPANQEMIDGYNDGRKADSPEPNANRSRSYRHGFLAGRGDLLGPHKAHGLSCDEILLRAEAAMQADDELSGTANEASRPINAS